MRQSLATGRASKVILAVLVILAIYLGWRFFASESKSGTAPLSASGTIEAEEVSVGAEIGGRVDSLAVEEGDAVKKGDALVAMDPVLAHAQLRQAQAAVDVARASLALVERGAREEEIMQAEAAVAQASAQNDAAKKALGNAKAMLDDPQDLNARIDAARPQVDAAKARLDALDAGPTPQHIAEAEAALRAAKNQLYAVQASADAQMGNSRTTFTKEMKEAQSAAAYEQVKVAEARLAQLKSPPTEEAIKQAQAAVDQAEANLDNLLATKKDPIVLRAQVDAAYGQYQASASAVQIAQAKLDALKAGASQEQLAVARAQVRQAEASAATVQAQLDKMTIKSPIDGIVASKLIKLGETASPGTRLLTIANLDTVKLVVYVPETRIGAIALGQMAEISVDSFPNRTFTGEVIFISSKAEFTPRNVQSQSERASTVFAVKIKIPNQDHLLKPGMPADAQFKT